MGFHMGGHVIGSIAGGFVSGAPQRGVAKRLFARGTGGPRHGPYHDVTLARQVPCSHGCSLAKLNIPTSC